MESSSNGRLTPVESVFCRAGLHSPLTDGAKRKDADESLPASDDEVARARARRRALVMVPPPPCVVQESRIGRVTQSIDIDGYVFVLELSFDRLRRRVVSHRMLSTVKLPAVFPAQLDDVRVRRVLEAIEVDGEQYVLELRFDSLRRTLIGHRLLRIVA